MAADLWYPDAVRKPLPWWEQAPQITTTTIVLHTAVSSAFSLFPLWAAQKPNGLASTGYVREDGQVEQYLPLNRKANAQFHANGFAASLESWDGGHPERVPWNAAQLAGIEAFCRWAISVQPIPPQLCATQNGAGVGYHCMWGVPDHRPNGWNWDGHTCPGAARIPQVPGIVDALRSPPVPPTPTEDPDMIKLAHNGALYLLDAGKIVYLSNPTAVPEAQTLILDDTDWSNFVSAYGPPHGGPTA